MTFVHLFNFGRCKGCNLHGGYAGFKKFSSSTTNLDEAEVAEAGHDLDAVPLGELLHGAAQLGTLQIGSQPPDFVPVGGHFHFAAQKLLPQLFKILQVFLFVWTILTDFGHALH